MKKEESHFIRHEPCENCGSSDAVGVFSDGHTYCFSCHRYNLCHTDGISSTHRANCRANMHTSQVFVAGVSRSLTARGINLETCEKFHYSIGEYAGKPCQIANYYDARGNLSGQKLRFADKSFTTVGKVTGCLFGSQLWSKGKKIVITEGEIDCLTVSQLQGNQWPVVSIPNGAQAAKKAIEANLEYLNGFDQIILMFDMDEPGRRACEEVAQILPIGKAYIATLPCKDPNECLKQNKAKDVIQAIWNAREYRPDGIVAGTDLLDDCTNLDDMCNRVDYPWKALNEKTRGIGYGELYVLTSGSGMGKSTVLRELEYYFGVNKGERCGIVALEESTRKTGLELMSIHLSRRIQLDPHGTTDEEKLEAFQHTVGNGNFYLYDHFGSLDGTNLLSKLRFLVVGLGCKRIFLDHISIVVSGMDTDEDGGERKAIDKLMTNLRSLVEETGCTMFVVSHLKRPEKKGHEEGGQVSLSQLRGSGAIAQLADMVIGLERDQQGDTPNVLTVRVLKNRFSGETGISGQLYYNPETGRLSDGDATVFDKPADCPF
nr:MAG TPA: DNA directed DNA polymerase [Caudoviricetes sp.]